MEILSDATFKGNVTVDKSLESYDLKLSTGQIKSTSYCSPITLVTNDGGYDGAVYEFSGGGSGTFLRFDSNQISTNQTIFALYLNARDNPVRVEMPSRCGTVALKSDIPNTSNFALKSEVNDVKNRVLHYAEQTINFDVPSGCTLFKVGPLTDRWDGEKLNGRARSASMFKVVSAGDPNELDPNKQLCYMKFANFADLMVATDGYVYINKASGYSISASDKYAVSVIW